MGAVLTTPDTKRILREAQSNPTFDAVVKWLAVELIQSLGRKRRVLKFNKAHGAVLLGPETETLVSALLGKDGLQLVLGRVNREVSNVESIAGRVLIGRIHGRIVGTMEMLWSHLVRRGVAQSRESRHPVGRHG